MGNLIIGLIVFLGIHSVRIVAADWRGAQLAKLGEMKWKGIYTAVSLVGFGLIGWGYGLARAEPVVVWSPPGGLRPLASVLIQASFVLIVAAYVPGTRIKAAVGHPMVLGVKVWSFAHLLVNGSLAGIVLFGSFLIWAVADYASLRRRDRAAGKTYAALGRSRDALAIGIGLVAGIVFARFLHAPLIGIQPF